MSKNLYSMDNFSGRINDIFYNKFDIVLFEKEREANIPAPILNILPGENLDNKLDIYEDSIEYKFNSEYFRSDDFTKTHNGTHVLFAGCSQTEGQGARIETTWSNLLYSKLNNENSLSGFFNLAKSGWGWQKVISNYLIYEQKYGKPEYLFILLPNIVRTFDWIDESNSWGYYQKYLEPSQDESRPDFLNISKKEYMDFFVNFVAGWTLFEKYCSSNNINMLWSSFYTQETQSLSKVESFQNYIPFTNEDIYNYIQQSRPDGKLNKYDLRRRDGHNGILFDEYWSKMFYEQSKKLGWFND